jgi:predicted Zn-dependent protease
LCFGCPSLPKADATLTSTLETCSDPDQQAELERAERALATGDHATALAAWRSLVEPNPACARLALLANRAARLADAEAQPALLAELRQRYEQVMAGNEPQARANAAFALALLSTDRTARRRYLARALELEPRHYFALVLAGEALLEDGAFEEARSTLNQAVSLRAQLAEGWRLLAQVAEGRGLYRTAAKHYETYLGLRPLDRQVQANYVRLLVFQLRAGDEAERVVADLWEADPTDLEVGLNRALMFFNQKKWPQAEQAYLELLRREPREPRLWLNLADLWLEPLAQPVRALQAYRWLVALPPSADPLTLGHQLLIAPSRIKDLEARLAEGGQQLPAPPRSAEDVLRS